MPSIEFRVIALPVPKIVALATIPSVIWMLSLVIAPAVVTCCRVGIEAEPVSTVKSNVEASPLVNVNTLPATLPVTIKLPVSVGVAFKAYEAVVANDALNACNAYEAVPSSEPVIPAVTFNEPVTWVSLPNLILALL